MVKKELIPDVQCKRCMQMHRPDDPMCPHCGFPLPDTRGKSDPPANSGDPNDKSNRPTAN